MKRLFVLSQISTHILPENFLRKNKRFISGYLVNHPLR